jgi:uncharacterized phage protein gp47/JayE
VFENITYEAILKRMLDRVTPTVDKREGSIIYDALAPAAVELQLMYIALDNILSESFADTESRQYLIRRAAELGIIPITATYALLKGEFNINVPIGARFSLDDLNYVITEKIIDGEYVLQCEGVGSEGNKHFGDLIPIDYINGLTYARLTELLIPGEDEEDTEHLRSRYFNSLDSQAFGGNIADYKEKVNKIQGVGGVKVYPAWNGGGTVKLVIINSDFNKPSDTLIDAVQTEIDPIPNQGEGLGIAPIGHTVTVIGIYETSIDVASHITLQEGYTWADVKPRFEAAITEYFEELKAEWDQSDNIVIRIAYIETRALGVMGIMDIQNTTLNDLAQNLVIDSDSIPVIGEVMQI